LFVFAAIYIEVQECQTASCFHEMDDSPFILQSYLRNFVQ